MVGILLVEVRTYLPRISQESWTTNITWEPDDIDFGSGDLAIPQLVETEKDTKIAQTNEDAKLMWLSKIRALHWGMDCHGKILHNLIALMILFDADIFP